MPPVKVEFTKARLDSRAADVLTEALRNYSAERFSFPGHELSPDNINVTYEELHIFSRPNCAITLRVMLDGHPGRAELDVNEEAAWLARMAAEALEDVPVGNDTTIGCSLNCGGRIGWATAVTHSTQTVAAT